VSKESPRHLSTFFIKSRRFFTSWETTIVQRGTFCLTHEVELTNLREIAKEGVDWIHVAQNRDQLPDYCDYQVLKKYSGPWS
jgi:hypothetical protein